MSDQKNCLTMTVPEAGALYLGLKPARAYQAAARGEIPTIRVGRLLRVPVAAMDRMLDQAEDRKENSTP
jgi:excisionase family DNA binding protein